VSSAAAITVRKFEGVELCAWGNGYLARDTEVAKWLKFDVAVDIRKLIRRNAEELNDYGQLATVEEWHERPQGGGNTSTVYYLNKEQALLVAMLSRAPGAAEVRKRLIRAFDLSMVDASESFMFRKLFLEQPEHTELLWSPARLAPIARLYGIKYDGGRPPLETRSVQRKIYDMVLGHRSLTLLREKYPDAPGTNGEPYIYDHFHPQVRAEFETQLDRTILPLARRASSARDFIDSLHHEYRGRPLQLVFSSKKGVRK
jgi:hypothetical protein